MLRMSGSIAAITILMADDDPDDRLMAQDAFSECGLAHTLGFVRDGEELLDYLLRRGEHADATHALPRLILLDLNMPRKDGRESLREIRANPQLCAIPIVVLTTSRTDEDMTRAQADGVDAFITKPASADDMLTMVRTLTKYWR